MIWSYIKTLYYYIRYRIKQRKREDSIVTIVEEEEPTE